MKFFLTITLFSLSISILNAQCPKIDLYVVVWEGETVTLKWRCASKFLNDTFHIFRTCLSVKSGKEFEVGKIGATQKSLEFADTDKRLKGNLTYQYKVRYGLNDKCISNLKNTQGRVIGDDSSTIGIVRSLESFTKRDVVKIIPQKQSAETNKYLSVKIEIKDLKFDFSSNYSYALISDNNVIETESQVSDDDFRFVNIFILQHSLLNKKMSVALIQGNEILGISDEIELK
jgi:hypothetical protein